MSGHGYGSPCPNCGAEANTYTDRKPYDYTTMECLECGFNTYVEIVYMNLDGLNKRRIEEDMEPLKELPKQEEI